MCQRFGLVHVSVKQLLRDECCRQPTLSNAIKPYLDQGANLPEALIDQLVQKRLTDPDCVMNGWVLEGFPQTEGQLNLLTSLGIKPSIVFQMDIGIDEAKFRFAKKKIDPKTGCEYNLGTALI